MSEDKNFVKDFPKRCAKILKPYEKRAKLHALEVTHMLAITDTVITFPMKV